MKYPDLVKILDKAEDQEYGHSLLFNRCYHELFNKELRGKYFWLKFGFIQSYLIFVLPVELKLKLARANELLAVKQFERDIASGANNKYIDIIKRIIKDEKITRKYTINGSNWLKAINFLIGIKRGLEFLLQASLK